MSQESLKKVVYDPTSYSVHLRDGGPASLGGNLRSRDEISKWYQQNYHSLQDGGIYYLGDEIGAYPNPSPDDARASIDIHCCLTYDSKSGAMGPPILMEHLHEYFGKDIQIERSFLPYRKDLQKFEQARIPMFGIETKTPWSELDVIAWSASFLPEVQNWPRMLWNAGIPLWRNERIRDERDGVKRWPILMLGGAAVRNIESMAGGDGGLIDVAFLGDGEFAITEMMEILMDIYEVGGTREDVLYAWATQVEGVYVPSYYEARWKNPAKPKYTEIKEIVPIVKGIPNRPAIRRELDMNDPAYYPLRQAVLTFDGQTIGKGEVQIAKSCNAFCTFCQEAWTSKPYRERGFDKVIEDFRISRINSGGSDVHPYSFNINMYSHYKSMLAALLKEIGQVDLISQRADSLAYDWNMAKLSDTAGAKTMTIGVEGGSQRLRDILCKSITESHIKRAFAHVNKLKFQSIKLFMISNIPGERPEDYDIELCNFLRHLKVYQEQNGWQTFYRLSFTPLYFQMGTPLQFGACKSALETGSRMLDKVVETTRELRVGFRTAAKKSDIRVAQMIHMADRRITPAMAKISLPEEVGGCDEIAYYLASASTEDKWEKLLEDCGCTFNEFFDEKPLEQVLPWDHIDIHISKEFLYKMYARSKAEIDTPYCLDGECFACGACPDADFIRDVITERIVEEQVRPEDTIIKVRQKHTHVRFLCEVDEAHRCVKPAVWHRYLGRAFMRSHPKAADWFNGMMGNSAQKPSLSNYWVHGRFYFDLSLNHRLTTSAMQQLVEAMNKEMRGIQILDVRAAREFSSFGSGKNFALYEARLGFSEYEIQDALRKFENSRNIEIKQKVRGIGMDAGLRVATREFDKEGELYGLGYHQDGHADGPLVKFYINGNLNPYEVLAMFFNVQIFRIMKYPVKCLDWFSLEEGRAKEQFVFYPLGDEKKPQKLPVLEIDFELERDGKTWVVLKETKIENLNTDEVDKSTQAMLRTFLDLYSDIGDAKKASDSAMKDQYLKKVRRVGLKGEVLQGAVEVDMFAEAGGICKETGLRIEHNLIGEPYSKNLSVASAISSVTTTM